MHVDEGMRDGSCVRDVVLMCLGMYDDAAAAERAKSSKTVQVKDDGA